MLDLTHRNVWLLAAALLMILGGPAVGADREPLAVVPVQGPRLDGIPISIDAEWNISFHVQGSTKVSPLQELVVWGSYADTDQGPQLVLTDGSVIVATILELSAESVVFESYLWREAGIAMEQVCGILVLPSADPGQRDREVLGLQGPAPNADTILLTNGDRLSGRLAPATAGLFGVAAFHLATGDGGQVLNLPAQDVVWLSMATRATAAHEPKCWLGFRDGTCLATDRITADGGMLQMTLACGARLRAPADWFWKELTLILPCAQGIVYLSDLTPASYRFQPFLDITWPLGVRRNVLGGRLRSGGKLFFHGLGLHSAARVVYDLPKGFRRLEGDLALDDQAGRHGSVVCRVLVERPQRGAQAWTLAYTSPTLRGGDPPQPLAVDVADASRIALVVEFAEAADVLDHVNWLQLRLAP